MLCRLIVPADVLEKAVDEMAACLASKSPVALRLAKSLLNRALQTDLTTTSELEAMALMLNAASEDYQEGIRAFKEKRKPVFTEK